VVILHEGQVRFDAPLAQDRGALDRAFLGVARGKTGAAA
jgi:hypothetical protein